MRIFNSNGSRKIPHDENCPPALILTLILNQTLTLTGRQFSSGQFSGHHFKRLKYLNTFNFLRRIIKIKSKHLNVVLKRKEISKEFSLFANTFFLLSHIWCFNPSHPNPRQKEKINLNFYFHTSLWCLKRFLEGFKALHKTLWSTKKECENKNLS